MADFLVDANLPRSLWTGEEFLHVHDLNSKWSDSEIWKFAKSDELTIITKDSDFSNRILASESPPKVIHFKTGNLRLVAFNEFLTKNWEEIKKLSEQHKLVYVYLDSMFAIV